MDRKDIMAELWAISSHFSDYNAGRMSKGRLMQNISYAIYNKMADEMIGITDEHPALNNELTFKKGKKK